MLYIQLIVLLTARIPKPDSRTLNETLNPHKSWILFPSPRDPGEQPNSGRSQKAQCVVADGAPERSPVQGLGFYSWSKQLYAFGYEIDRLVAVFSTFIQV